ncbi:STAS domain-containing protein [Qaidamihabitans albus]|uniref:STAS domain-containing protein n=1 Tax=Qaidamihabitans albus TaxID=2795733 RepID=UPI0018F15AE6|nr:STAS domain-containing protein [Qaidamihabitans albus]
MESSEPSESHSVTVAVEEHGSAIVLGVAGELDLLTAPKLQDELTRALDQRPQTLVIDLSKVEFMGSAGLSVLVVAHRTAGEHTKLRLVAHGNATFRPLRLTGLDQAIPVYRSSDEALNAE